jgi:hypothetical protein
MLLAPWADLSKPAGAPIAASRRSPNISDARAPYAFFVRDKPKIAGFVGKRRQSASRGYHTRFEWRYYRSPLLDLSKEQRLCWARLSAHSFSAAPGPVGDFRLRNAITTLKAMLGAFALFSASAGIAAPDAGTAGAGPLANAVVQASVLPSIEILPKQLNLAGRCNGSAFDVNTFINTTAQTSASVRVSSPVLNPSLLEQFTDNTGANVGVFNANYPNFHILGFGGGLAPNTPITVTITTYTGPNLTGTVTFTSTITFNCTTGEIARLARAPPLLTDVPALDSTGLALLIVLLGLAGAAALRFRRRAARAVR